MASLKTILVLFIQLRFMYSAPLQIPMQGYQMMPLVDQVLLQQQIMALQQLQAMQNLKTIHSPSTLYLPQPMVIMLPDQPTHDTNDENNHHNDKKNEKLEKEYVDEDLESVIIEAEDTKPKNNYKSEENQILQPKRALVLLPDGRQIIGSIISSIPWLPFEINVPDTIAWAYNGISNGIAGIISIIGGGQRNPFRPRPLDMKPESNVKMFLKKLQMKKDNNVMPIIIVPGMMPMNNLVQLETMPVWTLGKSMNWMSRESLTEE